MEIEGKGSIREKHKESSTTWSVLEWCIRLFSNLVNLSGVLKRGQGYACE